MQANITSVMLGCLITACGPLARSSRSEPIAPAPVIQSSESSPSKSELSLDGKALYENLCIPCHGNLNQSNIARASHASIATALQQNPDMQSLPSLSPEQVNLLVEVLGKIPPGKARNKP